MPGKVIRILGSGMGEAKRRPGPAPAGAGCGMGMPGVLGPAPGRWHPPGTLRLLGGHGTRGVVTHSHLPPAPAAGVLQDPFLHALDWFDWCQLDLQLAARERRQPPRKVIGHPENSVVTPKS